MLELPEKWDYETDVVVVGYGCAGAAAAIEARDAGSDVLILEKARVAGGTTVMSGGIIIAAGTSVQKERGIIDSPEEMYKYNMATGMGLNDPDMVKVFCENSGPNIEWLIRMGMEFKMLFISGAENDPCYASITPAKPRGHAAGGGATFFTVLKNACEKKGVKAIFQTRMEEVILSRKGHITGVKAEQEEKSIYIKAAKAVVLACGGYAYNREMLKQYSFDRDYRAKYTGSIHHMGDGIRAGQMLGADLMCMGQIGALPAVQRPGQKIARIALPPPAVGHKYSVITVNQKGLRFTNEAGYYNYIAYDMLLPGNLPTYLIFDDKARNAGQKAWPPWGDPDSKDIKGDSIRKADTIEELAIQLDIDRVVLEKTVNNYNINAEKGEDPEFEKTSSLVPIAPPFYSFELIVGMHSTLGGLKINTSAQVINIKGEIIPRLYAAGETTGGTIGFNYPASGTHLQNAICFGRIAGKNAASETPLDESILMLN